MITGLGITVFKATWWNGGGIRFAMEDTDQDACDLIKKAVHRDLSVENV